MKGKKDTGEASENDIEREGEQINATDERFNAPYWDDAKLKGKIELVWPSKDFVFWDIENRKPIWRKADEIPARIIRQKGQIIGENSCVYNAEQKKWIKSTKSANSENLLIRGDNLLALKALEEEFVGQVKLIYIDPPFNTGTAFKDYDDGLEHSTWLSMMKPRLEVLYDLLNSKGHIFVHIDYNELSYAKILLDEVFGRKNYVSLISWQRVPEGRTLLGQGQTEITISVEYILVYAKDNKVGKLNRVTKWINATTKIISQYGILVKNLGQAELIETFQDSKDNVVKISQHKNFNIETLPQKTLKETPEIYIKFFTSNYEKIAQSVGVQVESTFQQKLLSRMNKKDVLYSAEFTSSKGKYAGEHICDYYLNGRKLLFLKNYSKMERNSLFREVDMNNFWTHDEIPVTGTADEGGNEFKRSKKPEKLLQRIIELGSNPGDLVLDSFAGSGTTGAVAHKMGRKWIMIEMGKHAETHCKPRLTRVVSGEDQTGISKDVGWNGGGGFSYCELGEPLIIEDAELGIKRINLAYNNGDLIHAVCQLEGFRLISKGKKILHGKRGTVYAHVTEFFVNQEYVNHLSKEIDDDEKLRIYCYSHLSKLNLSKNVELKRMPDGLSNQDSG